MKLAEALEIFSQTHPGMVRSHNEDSVACEPACGLVVLADGMGGYNAGEVASGIAVSVVVTEVSHRLLNASPVDQGGNGTEELGVSLLRDNIQSQPGRARRERRRGVGRVIVARQHSKSQCFYFSCCAKPV
jgi:serine/threonine protein phosphatase PrpC